MTNDKRGVHGLTGQVQKGQPGAPETVLEPSRLEGQV